MRSCRAAATSLVLKRGQILRMTDIEGGANVSLMMLNAREKSERLNLPDTLKGQHTARLTAGHCFYSDMGRVPGWDHGRYLRLARSFWRRAECRRSGGKVRAGTLPSCVTVSSVTVRTTCWSKWANGILNLEDLLMVVNFFQQSGGG